MHSLSRQMLRKYAINIFIPEDGESRFLRDVGIHLQVARSYIPEQHREGNNSQRSCLNLRCLRRMVLRLSLTSEDRIQLI